MINQYISCKRIRSIFVSLGGSTRLSDVPEDDVAHFMKKAKPKTVCILASYGQAHNNFIFVIERGSMQERPTYVGKEYKGNSAVSHILHKLRAKD